MKAIKKQILKWETMNQFFCDGYNENKDPQIFGNGLPFHITSIKFNLEVGICPQTSETEINQGIFCMIANWNYLANRI